MKGFASMCVVCLCSTIQEHSQPNIKNFVVILLWESCSENHWCAWYHDQQCGNYQKGCPVVCQNCLCVADVCVPLCACSIVPLLPFYLSSWLSSFPCKHTLFKNMVNHSLLPQLPPPMARSVCKGRLVDRSDAGGTECTMVSSEPLCIQGLQGWTPCQFCIPRWCQNQYLDGQ